MEDLREGALARHMVYFHDGEIEPIRVLPLPLTVLPDQLAYIHHVTLTVQNALKRLPGSTWTTRTCGRFFGCPTRRSAG